MRSYSDVEKNNNKFRAQSCNSPWPNQKPNKVDLWILILRNHYLVIDPSSWWSDKNDKQINMCFPQPERR